MTTMKFLAKPVSRTTHRYLDRAAELSKLSECRRFHHGAIVVKNGHTVAVGVNAERNDPEFLDDTVAAGHADIHAEVAALNSCRKVNLEGAVIYIARTNRRGEPRMSKPCENCQQEIRKRGIRKVFYTIDSELDL